jgi:hypothetical protein
MAITADVSSSSAREIADFGVEPRESGIGITRLNSNGFRQTGRQAGDVGMGIYSHVTDDMGRETSDLFTGILADAQPLLHETVASGNSEAVEGA